MIVVIGLLALIVAVVLAAASVATTSGSTRPLSDSFVISGQHLKGLFTRQLVCTGRRNKCAVSPGRITQRCSHG